MSQSQIDIDGGWSATPHWAQRGDYFESVGQRSLYIVLIDRRDSHGYCHPSLSLLAHDAMISRKSVLNNLRRLEEMGLIVRSNRVGKDGGYISNEYYVSLDAPSVREANCPRQGNSEPDVGKQRTGGRESANQLIRTSVKNHLNNQVNTPIAPNGGVTDPTHEDGDSDNQTEEQSTLFDAPPEPGNEPKQLAPTGYTDEFESFWAVYPLKLDKRAAFKAFRKALKRVKLDVIMAGARKYADDPNLPEPRFIKHASTWLNGDGWDNPPLPSSKPASGRPNKARDRLNDQVDMVRRIQEMEQQGNVGNGMELGR